MLLFDDRKGLGLLDVAGVIGLVQQESVEFASLLGGDGGVVSQLEVVVDGASVQLLGGDVHVEKGVGIERGVVHGVEDALDWLVFIIIQGKVFLIVQLL